MHHSQHAYFPWLQKMQPPGLFKYAKSHLIHSFKLKQVQCLEWIENKYKLFQHLWLITDWSTWIHGLLFNSTPPHNLSSKCSFLLCSWTEQQCTRVFPMAGWLWYIYRPRQSNQQFPLKPSADNMFKVGTSCRRINKCLSFSFKYWGVVWTRQS